MPRSIVVRLFDAMLISVLVAACGGGASSPVITKPVISTAQPLPGTTGAAYRAFAFAVTSGGLAPFTWNETGALPPGLALNSAGVLSGTPTFAGTFPITVTVTDSTKPTAQKATAKLSLVVAS